MSRMLATFSVGLAAAFLWQRYLSAWLETGAVNPPAPSPVTFGDAEDFSEPEDLSGVDFSDPEDLSDVTFS